MKKFLANLVGLFTRSWGLKLLALALAIVIYYSIKSANDQKHSNLEIQHDRTLFQSR